MAAKDEVGKLGEKLAVAFLTDRGFVILDRNWRCPQGEIDLIARDDDATVFVEVKTRTSVAFGHPFEAITVPKLARLRRLAAAWCAANPQQAGRIRIDAIAVIAAPDLPATIEHLEGVF